MHNNELDDDYMNIQQNNEVKNQLKNSPGNTLSPAEQVDEIMDQSIEIESNKRMRNANVNPWTLRFKDKTTEGEVSNYHSHSRMHH